jgi:DNA replicative helicase MCM subunit Mcm2 (Cdc46/Mcm family)
MDIDRLIAYQNMLQKSLRKEEQTDKKIELLTIINQLTFGPRNLVQKEQIIVEAISRGFTEKEVEIYLYELIKENIIYESSPGFIKKK